MPIPDFRARSVWANVGIFVGAAVVVWLAGTRLAYSADVYLVGLLERHDHARLRMGYDSIAVGVPCSTGIVGLYFMR